MNIGAALRDIRENVTGKTQMQVSEATGISQTYLSQLENDLREPSREVITKLCNFYNIPEVILIWKATDREDIDANKRGLYEKLAPVINELVHQYFASA